MNRWSVLGALALFVVFVGPITLFSFQAAGQLGVPTGWDWYFAGLAVVALLALWAFNIALLFLPAIEEGAGP